jgi:hypothetical protein
MKTLGPEREVLKKIKILKNCRSPFEKMRGLSTMRMKKTEKRKQIDAVENEREGLEEGISLRERVKNIFKKYGFTVRAVILAVGTVIGVIVNSLTKGLKSVAKGVRNGLKTLGKKSHKFSPVLFEQLSAPSSSERTPGF